LFLVHDAKKKDYTPKFHHPRSARNKARACRQSGRLQILPSKKVTEIIAFVICPYFFSDVFSQPIPPPQKKQRVQCATRARENMELLQSWPPRPKDVLLLAGQGLARVQRINTGWLVYLG